MPLTGVCWRAALSVCLCVRVCGNAICVCPCVIAEPPGVSEQVSPWCHDSKPNWQAESHLAFAPHTYSNIHRRAALSVLRLASAVVRYKDEALWRLERPWEDESKKCSPPPHFDCLLLSASAAPSNRRTQMHLQQVSDQRNGALLWKRILKPLIPWLLVTSPKPDPANSWIHICSA